ncbi:prenyltransferase [Candidatus Thorarchaeota archaeon]|nr:MAG: prenyltransferase [Candidatus Thorarchaeota archaeon]
MTNIVRLAYKVSRVRFWLYLGGTYLVGYMIGVANTYLAEPSMAVLYSFIDPYFLLHLFYFILPANIFLYGVNDISDKDTDAFNPKKDEKEYRAVEQDARKLYGLVFASFLYGAILIAFQPTMEARFIFLSWMALSFLYSAPPLRLKARPVVDFLSNLLYVLPAILAFNQLTLEIPPLLPLLAAFSWTWAMQLFSAIPDIEADRRAGIQTTAVAIGRRASLVLCFIFWAFFAGTLIFIVQWNLPFSLLALVYPAIPVYILARPDTDIERVYWYYPYFTGVFGMVLFFSIGLPLVVPL